MRAQREVVVLVPREARQVEHDHEVNTALVQPAEPEQVLKLTAIRRLGALAFLVEAFEDFVALAAAEVEVRAMLEQATAFEASVVLGRFMIQSRHGQRPWVVIVEPDAEAKLLVVVTVYEVSQ